jgi:hypothetical protein
VSVRGQFGGGADVLSISLHLPRAFLIGLIYSQLDRDEHGIVMMKDFR